MLGHRDFSSRHLREVLHLQDLAIRDGETGGEFGFPDRIGLVLPGGGQRLGDPQGPRLRLLLLLRPTGSNRRHLGDQLLDERSPSPEDPEGLVEEDAVLVPFHENGMEGPVEVLPRADPGRLDRRDRIENRAGADRQARAAQRAREISNVVRQAALALWAGSIRHSEALRAPWTRSSISLARLPCIFWITSWYFSRTPSVSDPSAGSSATASSSTSAEAQSRVSATPGALNRSSFRIAWTKRTISCDNRPGASGTRLFRM